MESTAFSALPDVRPWRTTAYVAVAVAAVELVVLLVLGTAMLAKPVADRVKEAALTEALAPPAAKKPKVTPLGAPTLERAETAVLILNGNGRNGAASVESDRIRAKGYQVAAVADAPRHDYARSLVMFRPGFAPEAHRLARDLKIGIVGPLDGLRPAALSGAHAVVVIGLR